MSNRSIARKINKRKLEAAMALNRLDLIERLAAQPSDGQSLAGRIGAMLRKNRNSQDIPFDGRPVPYESDDTDDIGLEPAL